MGDGKWTYHQLLTEVYRRVGVLQLLGVGHESRVALLLPNISEFVFTSLATQWLGAWTAPYNWNAPLGEMLEHVARVDPAVVVTTEQLASPLRAEFQRSGINVRVIEPSRLATAPEARPVDPTVTPDDVCTLATTSGTTGTPKLIMQTHRGSCFAARGYPHWLGLDSSDRLLSALPLFHSHAQIYTTLGAISIGATAVVLERFSATTFWDDVVRTSATQISMMGAMLEILMTRPVSEAERAHSVRLCYTAPALPAARHQAVKERFGFAMTAGYALSECPYGMVWPIGTEPVGALGVLRQDPDLGQVNSARVVDDSFRDVSAGGVGQLLLRNPAIMRGYFRSPESTAEVLRDGWLWTGDLVKRDEQGLFWFVGRTRDLIRRRGQNIPAQDVESVVSAFPGVAMCAAVAVPSPFTEDDIKVFVVPASGVEIEPAALTAWCAERLASYKVPRYVEFVSDLPRTGTNKIAKGQLPRDRTATEHDCEQPRPLPTTSARSRGPQSSAQRGWDRG